MLPAYLHLIIFIIATLLSLRKHFDLQKFLIFSCLLVVMFFVLFGSLDDIIKNRPNALPFH